MPEKKLSEKEIDDIVISQADKNSEWGKPVYVKKTVKGSWDYFKSKIH